MGTCIAGNKNCNGNHSSKRDNCPMCGGNFYRCGNCMAVVPGSKSCKCGEKSNDFDSFKKMPSLNWSPKSFIKSW